MALTKEDKTRILDGYVQVLNRAQGLVVTEYRGMTMKQFNDVRKALREVNAAYFVTKNTLFKLALTQVGMAAPDELLIGPVAIGVAFGDLPSLTKAILQRAKENDLIKPTGAIMGQSVFTAKQLEMVSTMPTLDEARAGLIGTIVAPISSILSLLEQPAVQLMGLLQAYSDKDKAEGGAEAA
ncbi:MAG: 50S ribosomal protein L10 [Aggregatilineales bacterium]